MGVVRIAVLTGRHRQQVASWPVSLSSQVGGVRSRVRQLPGGTLLWRIGVTAVGAIVVGVGIVLLPLPGPGWLIIFAGLAVLATEYVWANRLLGWSRTQVGAFYAWAKKQPRWLQTLVGGSGLLLVGVIVIVLTLV